MIIPVGSKTAAERRGPGGSNILNAKLRTLLNFVFEATWLLISPGVEKTHLGSDLCDNLTG